jgi:hypothetical protein
MRSTMESSLARVTRASRVLAPGWRTAQCAGWRRSDGAEEPLQTTERSRYSRRWRYKDHQDASKVEARSSEQPSEIYYGNDVDLLKRNWLLHDAGGGGGRVGGNISAFNNGITVGTTTRVSRKRSQRSDPPESRPDLQAGCTNRTQLWPDLGQIWIGGGEAPTTKGWRGRRGGC